MNQRFIYILLTGIISCATLCGCSHTIPDNAKAVDEKAQIYPDYADVTIPSNIAPLNFDILADADEYITHIHLKDKDGLIIAGKTVKIDIDDWHQLLTQADACDIEIDIYTKDKDGWKRYAPATIKVAEPIDPYVTYRLIEPSYVNFEVMRIRQRCLENFEEHDIFNNCAFADEENGQCLNCHNPRNYNTDGKWQMHVRLKQGGTLIADGDKVTKVNLKTPETISGAVYPAWHPTLPVIAYSNNNTLQVFHSADRNKIEVQDAASDIILYDTESGAVSFVANDSTEWETFPAWSPDGKYLYYVSAKVPGANQQERDEWRADHYKDVKYDIYRKSFDPQTRRFGATDTIYMASVDSLSAILPRVSPDGKYLLFTVAEYGTFHIWHHDADLCLMDLTTGEMRPLSEANSDDTESYHTWSSNGRWIIFSSRRDDGDFTRLYMAYFDKDGKAHKPFMMPQELPQSNIQLFKSYNVPELMVAPVTTDKNQIFEAIEGEAVSAKFAGES